MADEKLFAHQWAGDDQRQPEHERMNEPAIWRVIDCFSGPECWCGIVVSPDGEECNNYGEISKADCHFIVDAMNKNYRKQYRQNNNHPLPWHIKISDELEYMVTTKGLASDKTLDSIGFARAKWNGVFVDAVNAFYVYQGKEADE